MNAYDLGSRVRALGYDAAGQVTAYQDSDPTHNQSFGYDEDGALTQVTMPAGTTRYTYDLNGNRSGPQPLDSNHACLGGPSA